MRWVARTNMAGYLPEEDEPPTFETPGEAWSHLAGVRLDQEEAALTDEGHPYSDTYQLLRAYGVDGHPADVVYGTDALGRDFTVAYEVARICGWQTAYGAAGPAPEGSLGDGYGAYCATPVDASRGCAEHGQVPDAT